jgi:hypothetical protein
MGIGYVLQSISSRLQERACSCLHSIHKVVIGGLSTNLCTDCIAMITQYIDDAAYKSPHVPSITITIQEDGAMEYVISFCTGTLMRCNSNRKWIALVSWLESSWLFLSKLPSAAKGPHTS